MIINVKIRHINTPMEIVIFISKSRCQCSYHCATWHTI